MRSGAAIGDDIGGRRRRRLCGGALSRLHAPGFSCESAADVVEARALLGKRSFTHAVVDLRMPGPSGLVLAEEFATLRDPPRFLLLSGFATIPAAIQAVQVGAVTCLAKPADADRILTALGLADGQEDVASPAAPETPSLARVEWEHLHRVLADVRGNVTEAARRLKIPRRTLQRKLRRLAPR